MPPAADPNQTVVTTGQWLPGYVVESVVGTGGTGTVFRARQLKLDRVVALKVIQLDRDADPTRAARFEAEAVTLGKFHHPNIVQVYDYGYHEGRLFIAMELLEGEDLDQRIKRVGRLGERAAWSIARQTAAALAHAAALGVVHRDVKPPNLFLVPAPTGIGLPRDLPMVKVTDFGLATTRWAADAADGRRTAPGILLGTPVYMAPEQYRSADVDHRADIYALGATVFHALAGSPPFDGATVWDVMAQKLEHTPKSWPEASRESVALIAWMMAPNPKDRVGSYEELIDRIERLPALREPVLPPPRPSVVPLARRRWRGVVAAALVLAVTAAGLVAAVSSGRLRATAGAAPAVRFVSTGPHEALFDGRSIAGWLPPSAGGEWTVEADDEGARVLAGALFVRRTFAQVPNYRLTIGLDVHTAAAAEVHFAIPAKSPDAGRRLVLRVSRAGGAVFGTKDGDAGPFRPAGAAVEFPPAAWFEGRRPYLEVRVERAGGTWAAWFNGKRAGYAVDDGTAKLAEIRLHAEGGRARVDSAILEQLVTKDD
jgi:eukaryotic-like serine/threonine-protein kinase